mgnify:FL=1|jgi:hypothetical protein
MEMPKRRLGAGRVAFLARKEEIKVKIEAGYTMISIYEGYQNQLGISYGQFVNYVNKFIRRKTQDEAKPEPAGEKPEIKNEIKPKKEAFTFDANSGNTDDFI